MSNKDLNQDAINRQIRENLRVWRELNLCGYYYSKYDSGFCSKKDSLHYKVECPYKGEDCGIYNSEEEKQDV